MKKQLKSGLTLGIYALLSVALIGVTNELTGGYIKAEADRKLTAELSAMLPGVPYDNNIAGTCRLIKDERLGDDAFHELYTAKKGNEVTGFIFHYFTHKGYSGDIELLTGTDKEGTVRRVQVLRLQETPGLGDQVEESKSDWLKSFKDKNLGNAVFKVRKDGGDFDSFTGATITPRAITEAVGGLLEFEKELAAPDGLNKFQTPCGGRK